MSFAQSASFLHSTHFKVSVLQALRSKLVHCASSRHSPHSCVSVLQGRSRMQSASTTHATSSHSLASLQMRGLYGSAQSSFVSQGAQVFVFCEQPSDASQSSTVSHRPNEGPKLPATERSPSDGVPTCS